MRSHATHVSKGLLWVYGAQQGGTGGSATTAPPAHLLMPEGWEIKSPWFQRDVPLSYDVLFENFLDPSHVPHSHHGVIVSVGRLGAGTRSPAGRGGLPVCLLVGRLCR